MATPTQATTTIPTAQELRDAINRAGSIEGAAALLGNVHRTTLYRWLRQHNIETRRVIVAR